MIVEHLKHYSFLLAAIVCISASADNVPSFGNVSRLSGPSVKIYKHYQNGVPSFSDIKPMNERFEVIQIYTGCYACDVHSTINWNSIKLHLNEYESDITESSQSFGVDPALIRALIHAESAFNPNAKSPKGALGLMQLMPTTAKELGVRDPRVASQNIHGGVKYLAMLLSQFNGNITLATAAYNAGPNAVDKYKGVPPYAETQAYVERVKILHQRYKEQT